MALKAPKFTVHEMAEAYARYKELRKQGIGVMECCEIVGEEVGRDTATIYKMVNRLQPTVEIAEAYIRSQSLRLAMRVVRKANSTEAIDILSRKNVGVLAPKTEESGGQGGFFMSVTADSCGAVKIGIAAGAQRQEGGEGEARIPSLGAPQGVLQASTSVPIHTLPTIDVQPTGETHEKSRRSSNGQGSYLKRGAEVSDSARAAIQAARKRIRFAERSRRREQSDGRTIRARIESLADHDESTGGSD